MQTWEEKIMDREKGREEASRNIAANMLKKGIPEEDVMALTECSRETVDEIKKELQLHK